MAIRMATFIPTTSVPTLDPGHGSKSAVAATACKMEPLDRLAVFLILDPGRPRLRWIGRSPGRGSRLDEDSHLPRLSRDDPGRSTRARGDAPLLRGAVRECRLEEPFVRLAGRGGGRGGPRARRGPHRRHPEGDRLDER